MFSRHWFSSMEKIIKSVRDSFVQELENNGDIFRVLRKETLSDLIVFEFVCFEKDASSKHLINLINFSIKSLLLSEIGEIHPDGSLEDFYKRFNKQNEYVLDQYDLIWVKLKETLSNYSSTDIFDLRQEMQYLKVINNLKIRSFSDDILIRIISVCCTALNNTIQ
jgi:hypothetical protein